MSDQALEANQIPPAKRRAPLPMVFIERPRCPACESPDLQTIRSKTDADGSVARRTQCRACGEFFLVIVD